jgi:hypothetical protein
MRSIDMHAHLTPQCFIRAMQAGKEWHGISQGRNRLAPGTPGLPNNAWLT